MTIFILTFKIYPSHKIQDELRNFNGLVSPSIEHDPSHARFEKPATNRRYPDVSLCKESFEYDKKVM